MKKALFILMFATIAFTGVSNAENTTVTFKSITLGGIDLTKNNAPRVSTSAIIDTTKKGGRGNETPYKGTGGKKETFPVAGKEAGRRELGKGGIQLTKEAGRRNNETPYKGTGNGGKESQVGNDKKETDGNSKTEAVIFRQPKNK